MTKTKKRLKKFSKKIPRVIEQRRKAQKVRWRKEKRQHKRERREKLEKLAEEKQAQAEQEIQEQIARDDEEALHAAKKNPLLNFRDNEEHEEEEEDEIVSEAEGSQQQDSEGEEQEQEEEEEEGKSGEEEEENESEVENEEEEEEEDEAEGGQSQVVVTMAMLDKVEKDAHLDFDAFKRLVLIFRSACQSCDPELNRRPPFVLPDAATFDRVMTFCLRDLRAVLEDLLVGKVQGRTYSDQRLLGFMKDKNERWQAAKRAVNTFVVSALALLNQLEHGAACAETLRLLHHVVPLFGAFPVLARRFLDAMLAHWASPDVHTRTMAFRNMHALAVLDPARFLERVLKAAYSAYIKHSRLVSRATLPVQHDMRGGLVELLGISVPATYRLAFASVRQLALHLRGVAMQTLGAVVPTVHSFQFLNALRVWAAVLVRYAPASETIRYLLYPLMQTLLAAIDASDGARLLYFRLHVAELVLDVCEAAGVFANIVPHLIQCLYYPQLRKAARDGSAPDFATHVVVPKRALGTAALLDTVQRHVCALAGRFYAAHAYSIAFPELAQPFVVHMRKLAEQDATTPDIDALAHQVEANAQWVVQRRIHTDFSPKDVDRTRSFLAEDQQRHRSPFERFWLSSADRYSVDDEDEDEDEQEFESADDDDDDEYDEDDDEYGEEGEEEEEEDEEEDE